MLSEAGENFKEWLIEKGLGMSTAGDYSKFIERKLLLWMEGHSLSIEHLENQQLMHYIRYRRGAGIKPKTINLELRKISYLLEFKGLPDIAQTIRVKGVQRRIPHDLFTEKELDEIYNQFPGSRNPWTHEDTLRRYHIILGLKIYQGLQEQELQKLGTIHLQLDKGRIYIPSTKRTNDRILDLKPFQVLPLHDYLLTDRKTLYKNIEDDKRLFPASGLKRGMSRIREMINRYEPRLKSLHQIRPSVITNWLNHCNLREAQYMAGHKYVSSTERYRMDNLEDLQKELEKYHPLR